jgi:hypothetical protein
MRPQSFVRRASFCGGISNFYSKAIQLIFREDQYAMRKCMVGQWPIYTFAALL